MGGFARKKRRESKQHREKEGKVEEVQEGRRELRFFRGSGQGDGKRKVYECVGESKGWIPYQLRRELKAKGKR